MQKLFTRHYIKSNRGCYSIDEVNNCSFMQKTRISLMTILNSEISLKDKLWFLIKKTDLTSEERMIIAVNCAKIVLPIYESEYPNDKSIRECIKATKAYIEGNIDTEELAIKGNAAKAAVKTAYIAHHSTTITSDVNISRIAALCAANAVYNSSNIDSDGAVAIVYAADAVHVIASKNSVYADKLLHYIKNFVRAH